MHGAAARPLRRMVARGRPSADPACAGCAQLGLFRALRRAGLEVEGRSGCDRERDGDPPVRGGRWAALTGAAEILAGAGRALAAARQAGARLLVLVDHDRPESRLASDLLRKSGAPVFELGAGELLGPDAALRLASLGRGAAVVVLTPCARLARRGVPLAIAAARCNRCGACLALGCPAISDEGGEALSIDPAVCAGCRMCAPLCRARAIAAAV